MTRLRSNAQGFATDSMAAYYAQRASAGLIVTEGIQPSAAGQSNPMQPGLVTDEQALSWRRVTDAVHGADGRIFAQIMHAGRISHPDTTGHHPEAPSALAARDVRVLTPTGPAPAPVPRALGTAEIPGLASTIAHAARRAVDAGFDGAELHGANGYLIALLLSDTANQRTDRYGGTIAGRIPFAVEAAEATVDAIGRDRVGIRLSPGAGIWDAGESDAPELYRALLTALAPLGLAYVHFAAGPDEGVLRDLRRFWPGALIVNPSSTNSAHPSSLADAERWLGHGADLISFGRAFLANPDLPERLRSGVPPHGRRSGHLLHAGRRGISHLREGRKRPEPGVTRGCMPSRAYRRDDAAIASICAHPPIDSAVSP
ncbi:alkene reductase [Microbacterium sp. gxy059]|uniref:oxidoreductase n=1 Tax=Microbacterium sp. gxy059 TaxID=2957199 RepID=UPI003D97B38E